MSLEKEYDMEKIALARRKRALVEAFIKRAKTAGIPREHRRVPQDDFESLLDTNYHSSPKSMGDTIYKTPDKLLKIPFIIIDGGTVEDRKRAGFAILFRIISFDRFGRYKDASELCHRLSTWDKVDGVGRHELADSLKEQDALFISEFSSRLIRPHYDSGDFFDEIIGARRDKGIITIVSFSDVLNKNNIITNTDCGTYLAGLSSKQHCDSYYDDNMNFSVGDPSINPSSLYLRVRVTRSYGRR